MLINKVYTITEISGLIKGVVEHHFTGIQVKAELSSVKKHSSGHIYLTLKEGKAVLNGICWKGMVSKLATQPQEGLEVICTGRLTTFPMQSKYQMIIESMELAGEGVLLKRLEELKKKLMAEGLFDPNRKQDIPLIPQKIGIITSPTGAVIRDILHRLQDRFPTSVLLWPVPVQGEGAALKIAAAIEGFNILPKTERPDVLIVARGGGSLEDLWCFNEECVVRAVANSQIPLISAVGHETDTTLIDYASDHRAPTPTAAAERAVPVRQDLRVKVQDRTKRLNQSMRRLFEENTQRLDDRQERLGRAMDVFLRHNEQRLARLQMRSPRDLVLRQNDALKSLSSRFVLGMRHHLQTREKTLDSCGKLLESYSYTRTLERGFSLVKNKAGEVIRRAKDLVRGDLFEVHFADGRVEAQVSGNAPTLQKPRSKKKSQKQAHKSSNTQQGSLF